MLHVQKLKRSSLFVFLVEEERIASTPQANSIAAE